MNKKLISALTAAAALGFAAPATAGFFDLHLDPYVTASVGQGTINEFCNTGGFACDDSDIGFKGAVGMVVNDYISMEVGYVDLGKYDFSGFGATGSVEVNGMTFHALGTYPVNDDFKLYLRGGFGILHTDIKSNVALPVEETDLEFGVGLGMQYNFTKAVGMRLEWERYMNVGDRATTGDSEIDFVSAGLVYTF